MKARQLPPYKELSREDRERLYEHDLPVYLHHDLDAFKDGLENGSTLMDCLWGELYGSRKLPLLTLKPFSAAVGKGLFHPAETSVLPATTA